MIYTNRTRNILDLNRFLSEAKLFNSKIEYVMKFNDDNLRFTLSEELTEQEDLDLDDFVENFDDQDPELKKPLIYQYAKAEASSKHFHNIDYKKELTVRLQKESKIVKGEMQVVTWYRHMEFQVVNGLPVRVYSVPVLKTENKWERDDSGFVIYKHPPVRTWFNFDGTENEETKEMEDPYYYEDFEVIDEGYKRRTLLVKAIQIPTMNLIAEVMVPLGMAVEIVLLRGRKFLDDYDNEFNKFRHNSSSVTETHLEDGSPNPDFNKKSIVVKLREESDPEHSEWLDKKPLSLGGAISIRDHLMSEFDI